MLEITNLRVKYDTIRVIHGINLSVREGELIALIGANGAGKTTILKTLSGLLKPEAGEILFAGRPIQGKPCHQIAGAGVIHVPEGRQIFPKMTIEENLRLGAFLETNRQRQRQNLEWVFQLFPILKERYQQTAGTLSGGEQQMLAIGRAILSNPRLLLLDEPSMGLSPLMTEQVFEVISTLKSEGITMLLVEQNAYDALEISDRAYILETGTITQTGESRQLIEDPAVKRAYLGGA